MSNTVVLLQIGDTFKCGKDGHITGTILTASASWMHPLYSANPETVGYIYTLNKDVNAFKRVWTPHNNCRNGKGMTIPLRIPAGTAIRAPIQVRKDNFYHGSIDGFKCRAAAAVVLDYEGPVGYSDWASDFTYAPGMIVRPQFSFDMNPSRQCSSGIHFFFEKKLADSYFG